MADSAKTPQPVAIEGEYSPSVQKAISLGNKEYVLKNYEKAVEYYGQASELQAKGAGEDDPDILFLYGKALFQVAQRNSQVLGGAPASDPSFDPKQVLASATTAAAEPEPKSNAKISFSGDPEDEEDQEEEEEEEEKEDDFQIAWEVLETAKALYEAKLESRKGKGTIRDPSEETAIERKIADVCDLLGEVSIENESFDAAVQDLTRALELKVSLYETSDPIVSEAHYKLSLALEFAQHPSPEQSRALALQHLESAIASVKERVEVLEKQGKTTEANDAKEMVQELTVKVDEMRNPVRETVDVSSIFGAGIGINEALQAKLAETLAGSANDLTGLVKKKDKLVVQAANGSVSDNASMTGEKRKIDEGVVVGSPGKKLRVEDVEDKG